jgi:hypothetical protein
LLETDSTGDSIRKLEGLLMTDAEPTSNALRLLAVLLSLPIETTHGSLGLTAEVQRQRTIDTLVE